MSKQLPGGEKQWTPDDLKVEPDPNENELNALDAEKWTQVYKFRYIVHLRTIVRFKIYTSALFLVGTPAVLLVPLLGLDLRLRTYLPELLHRLLGAFISIESRDDPCFTRI